jgi:hypothetical protein
MPIGELIGDLVAQAAMEAGGEAIERRYGWKGCFVAVGLVIGAIALAVWAFS